MKEHAVFTFGRFNPPTTGHGKLVNAVVSHADKNNADHYVFASHTQDSKKNPLSHGQKVHFLKKLFPKANVSEHPDVKTAIHAVKHLSEKGHKKITMVVGSDRVDHFHKLLHQYNGKEYHVPHLEVVSAGHRDPDAEGIEGMSASKQREHASKKNFREFAKGVPVKKHAKELYHAVRKGMRLEGYIPHFKALFLVGGPGSGKDFLIHSVLDECYLKEVQLEKMFNAIVEQQNIEEVENFPAIVVNGNADNLDKIIVAKAVLESMGYDTAMIYVYTSDKESKTRNEARIARGAKTFSESLRKKKYDSSVHNMNEFAEIFESFVIYDNSNNFSTVNEDKQKEITSWLVELSETITGFLTKTHSNEAAIEWIVERVLEVGSNETAKFAKAITPGQSNSKKVLSYADADKYVGGVAIANKNTAERTYAAEAKKQALPPSNYGDVRNMAVGSTGIASIPYAEDGDIKKKIKLKKYPSAPIAQQFGNVQNFGNPDASMGITAYTTSEESKNSFKNFVRDSKGN